MAAVAQRQSSSPRQMKRPLSATGPLKADVKVEVNRSPRDNDLETPSNYLVSSDKFLATEHNPFEQSFAFRPSSSNATTTIVPAPTNGTETPKPALPGLVEMFTPGGTNQFEHFNFGETLRHGPLSPNLLSGPQAPLSFDPNNFRTGLTPNESNIRTGLTPGGNGGMVPGGGYPMLPTPGTAALLGPYTPNTASAIVSMQSSTFPVAAFNPTAPPGRGANDPFGENQAANGLVFLAQTSQQQAQQPLPVQIADEMGKRGSTVSVGSSAGKSVNVYQDPSALMNNNVGRNKEDTPQGKARGKKKDEGVSNVNGKDVGGGNKKKTKSQETDDDKRRNFLERNRQAALKCRQRKKQWLSSLQQKVDWYSRENTELAAELGRLREEITSLKTILAAHKDCPVAQQNGATSDAIAQTVGQNSVFPVHAYR